ncbi:MAG: hypothetical protein KAS32_30080 [Candidatus Peribacteraceae bacterium]|nr:hypothetical protein [Candidatus Peribacteraceae bacterium]
MARGHGNERIAFTDSIADMIIKLSGGNPGAVMVCTNLSIHEDKIDMASAFGPISSMLSLDSCGIWEERIWMLFKDVCGGKLAKLVGTLRACQLGFMSGEELDRMIDGEETTEHLDSYLHQVKERLGDKIDLEYEV